MRRPHIICHMVTTLDGRLAAEHWPYDEDDLMRIYDGAAERLEADGWIVGRVTMEYYMTRGPARLGGAEGPRHDRIGDRGGRDLGICFDREGKLTPQTDEIEDAHLVFVLSERVSEEHVRSLVGRGVSVFFSGRDGDDLAGVLARIHAAFGTRRLLLEGGGVLNGAFLEAHLIDEMSTLILPLVDGRQGTPAIYEHPGPRIPDTLALVSAETLDDGTVWLRHRAKHD